jgi:hypothetical protein
MVEGGLKTMNDFSLASHAGKAEGNATRAACHTLSRIKQN